MPIDDDQRARLRQAKLRAIVREAFDEPDGDPASYPNGAALITGDRAFVLVEDATPRSAGGPVLWATREGLGQLDVLVDLAEVPAAGTDDRDVAADLARRLALFDPPARVWSVDGSSAVAVERGLPPDPEPAPDGTETLIGLLVNAGLDVVTEDGIVRGEELGLEVARIVPDPDVDWRLEVGVGQFDQAAAAMMYADRPTADALDAVVREVRRHRYAGAPMHPVRNLCRERWLRHMVIAEPDLVGATFLRPIESTVSRRNLRDPHPAFAVGSLADGSPVVVACTYGVDVDLLPLAADVRDREAPDAELVVVSAGDLPASVHSLADRMAGTVRFVRLAAPWEG